MSNRKPAAPANLRNGLKWREGRPRWEPSPASRTLGLKGLDLKAADGKWMERGAAIAAADARHLWATFIRDAAHDLDASAQLREALASLEPPETAEGRHRRALLGDLLDKAHETLGEGGEKQPLWRRERSVAALAEAYFATAEAGKMHPPIAASTIKLYRTHSRRLLAKFGDYKVDGLTRGKLIEWHAELMASGVQLGNANVILGTTAAIFAWGARQDPPWLENSPVTKLKLQKARGRLVFWEREHEEAFVPWADANGLSTLADAVVTALWTGARPIDMCAANLADLLRANQWRYIPIKTARHEQIAMPTILPPVRERLERIAANPVRPLDDALLVDPDTGRRLTRAQLTTMFRDAKAAFVASGRAPPGFNVLKIQDCRDTCVTRLWEAVKDATKIWTWTGHSPESVHTILREHYIVLRAKGSAAMARELVAWAKAEGMAWAQEEAAA